jgi:hypothetical protein
LRSLHSLFNFEGSFRNSLLTNILRALLFDKCPFAEEITWSDFVKDSDTYLEDLRKLVAAM